LYSVTGGKLTTFRLIALDVLKAVRHHLSDMPEPSQDTPVLNQIDRQLPGCNDLRDACRRRLLGRYGSDALAVVNMAQPGEMETIPGTDYLWVELRWAARSEGVCHLEDLLLRRTRLGLVLPAGGASILPVVKQICQPELHWTDSQWQREVTDYQTVITQCYSLPPYLSIPDWKVLLTEVLNKRKINTPEPQVKLLRRIGLAAGILLILAGIIAIIWRINKRSNQADGAV
jgi:glycerol-3-phosphate dehydrogenase